ncbi:hypothetical protein DFH09DRAFT_1102255 [Mycena vulgaris]|nr:hypothetical protein DFH09DRAFT_1102255 [Mycena vulgaris]
MATRKMTTKTGAAGPVPSLPPAPSGAGLWGNLQFSTVPEARNLIRWMMGGCPRARAMFLHLICFYGGSPCARRPDGIQYILHKQNRAESGWLHTTMGDSTPMSRRAEAGKEPPARTRNQRCRDQLKKLRATEAQKSAVSSVDPDVLMPAAAPTVPHRPSYAGRALLATTPTQGRHGSGVSLDMVVADMVVADMASRATTTWVQGTCLEDGGWPTADTPIGTRPLEWDVTVTRLLHFLAPIRESSSIHHAQFLEVLLTGLSMFGLFERMHGVALNSLELAALHAYAASWRNSRERTGDPAGQVFAKVPRGPLDVLSWPNSRITRWGDLMYGPVCAGVQSSATRFPARMCAPVPQAEDTEMPPVPPAPAIMPDTNADIPDNLPEPTVTELEYGEIDPAALNTALPDSADEDDGDGLCTTLEDPPEDGSP